MRARTNRLAVQLTPEEREAIEELAHIARLPASTFVRNRILQECEFRGLLTPGSGMDWQKEHRRGRFAGAPQL